ncbi:MAG: hypothetical protein JO033_14065 [Acidobacteriaceae bacterium]|nr:hypothetical protein [Acidobacteriaceae bacterium]MBV9497872.1 hypothetical protein [Acidobacteriaceae bacterium]
MNIDLVEHPVADIDEFVRRSRLYYDDATATASRISPPTTKRERPSWTITISSYL